MGSPLTVRLSDELAAEIDRISEAEGVDESTVVQRLLRRAVTNYRRDHAFERYEQGEHSLGPLAEEVDLPLHATLGSLRERGIHFRYSAESLAEDYPDE